MLSRTILQNRIPLLVVGALLVALFTHLLTNVGHRLSAAREQLTNWNLVDAEQRLQSLVEQYPESYEARRLYAQCLLRRGELQRARAVFSTLVESDSAQRHAHLLSLSLTHFYLGNLDTATHLAYEVLSSSDPASAVNAGALNLLGRVAFNQGQYDSAMTFQRRSLDIARTHKHRHVEADALRQIGVLYWYHGRSDSARTAFYQPALEIYREVNDRIGEATTLNNIALAGGPMRNYLDAFAIRKRIGDQIGLADSYYFVTGGRIDHWSDLMYSFRRKSLEISRRIGYLWGEDVAARAVEDIIVAAHNAVRFDPAVVESVMMVSPELQVQRMLRRSSELLREGRLRESADMRERTVGMCDSIGYTIGLEQALALQVAALTSLGEYARAEAVAERLCRVWTANPVVAKFQLAKVYVGAGKTAEAARLLETLTFQVDTALLGMIARRDETLPFRSADLLTTRYELSSLLVEALYDLGRHRQMFNLFEVFRCLPFGWSVEPGGMSPGEESTWHRYVQLLEEIDRESDDVDRLLIEFDMAYQRSLDRTATATRAAMQLFERSIPSMSDIQRSLRGDQVLVEYFVGKKSAYFVALRRDTLLVLRLREPPVNVNSSARTMREVLLRGRTSPGDALWRGPAAFLYGVLVQPLRDHHLLNDGDHLIVSPHGKLLDIPFACLLDSAGIILIERFTLSTLPSARYLLNREPRRKPLSLLAVAPERKSLPFAKREVTGIPSSLFSVTIPLFNDEASISEFMRHAPAVDVIHIAAHGSVHRWNPLFSSLQLSDGLLELHGILNLRLSADLVVLSSCETGYGVGMTGEIAQGHEAVGFPLAFLSSGASSVIAPLWIVEDRATSDLMLSMYSELQSMRRPDGSLEAGAFAKALSLAQRQFVTSPHNQHKSHPFYWAGFYLMGNPN